MILLNSGFRKEIIFERLLRIQFFSLIGVLG